MASQTSSTYGTGSDVLVIVTAYDEADRIGATLDALGDALPSSRIWVADDGSRDQTAAIARARGASVVRAGRMIGKGGAATLAARELLERLRAESGGTDTAVSPGTNPVVVLCDGDLGSSAARLAPLAHAVASGEADLAVAAFSTKVGGGFGLALGYARRAIRRRCGLQTGAPISGQRAMRASTLGALLPFASGFGMEVGMTIDAVRAGLRVVEVEIDLAHRATGRTLGGFAHRGRQLLDIMRAGWARR